MPRTVLATLEVDSAQSIETTGLLAIYDLSTDTVSDKRSAALKQGDSVTYRYSALLRNARMTMLPEGNVMLDDGVLFLHAKKIMGPIVAAPDALDNAPIECAGQVAGRGAPMALQLASWAIAAPSIVTTPTNAMITWFPIVIHQPIRAVTIGTDFIVQAIAGSSPATSVVRVFLVSEESKIAIEPEPWNGAGDPPVAYLDSPKKYFEVVGQEFGAGRILDMTEAQQAFVDEVVKDAERLGVM